MSFLTWLTNIAQRAIRLLLSQFARSTNLQKLLRIIVEPLQDLENVARDLKEKRSIDTGEGVQLDLIGEWIGEPRQGRDDNEYRRWLRFRIFVNTSDGEPETVIAILRFLTGATDVEYWENYPAALQLYTNGPDVSPELIAILQGVAPAGIGDIPVTFDLGNDHTFRLALLPEPVPLLLDDQFPAALDDGELLLLTGRASDADGSRLVEPYATPVLLDDANLLIDENGFPILLSGVGVIDPRETAGLLAEVLNAEQPPAQGIPYPPFSEASA